jgi:hypothetical protein
MFQRANVASMSAPTGELGKYVNRLGWAVSSEEQRLAAIGRILEYAKGPNGSVELEQLATRIQAATSLVFNPEGAIDAGVGAKMKVNLSASNSDLLMAFNLTRGVGFSEEIAQRSLGNALFSLLSADDKENKLSGLAKRAGLVDDSGKLIGSAEEVMSKILARNDELSKELIGVVNLASDNVGNALVKNTAQQMGMIRALQELYPDIKFNGIGMVGFDQFSSDLKLSTIIDDAGNGDINTVINSIAEGAERVTKILKVSLPENSVISKINNIARAGEDIAGRTVSGEEAKFNLLEIFQLDEEGMRNYGIKDPVTIMENVNEDILKFQNRMKQKSFNPYAPIKGLDLAFVTPELDAVMKQLTGEITASLKDGNLYGNSYGKSIEDLIIQNNILEQVERTKNFNRTTLNPRTSLAKSLMSQGIVDRGELDELKNIPSKQAYRSLKDRVTASLTLSRDSAQLQTRRAVQKFFTDYTQEFQNVGPGSKMENVEDVMDRLLFEIEQMKNASRVRNPTIIQEVQTTMGTMLEAVLKSDEAIEIAIPGMEKFSVQNLASYVRTNNELRLTKGFAAQQTNDMVALIQALSSKRAIERYER